jgi:hypothetical protein
MSGNPAVSFIVASDGQMLVNNCYLLQVSTQLVPFILLWYKTRGPKKKDARPTALVQYTCLYVECY